MRSKFITYFCLLWAFSLLAPSIITLVDDDAIGVVMTLTEEEHKDANHELHQTVFNQAVGLNCFLQLYSLASETPFYTDLGIPQVDWEVIIPPPKFV